MSKSLGIAYPWLLIVVIALFFPSFGNAQPMPEKLDMEWLLSQPKYRNIHHDSFCRADNDYEIGHNALPNRPNVLSYETMMAGNVQVGIRNNCASNFNQTRRGRRCIKYINTNRNSFHITAIRHDEDDYDLKVAFYIKDINNYFYAQLASDKLEVYRLKAGKKRRIYTSVKTGKRLELQIDKRDCSLMVDGIKSKRIRVGKQWAFYSNLCGLFFDDESVSMVEDFIVDFPDKYEDVGIDHEIENCDMNNPSFGTYCSEKGACSSSESFVSTGNKSYRFELNKPSQEQVDNNRDRALHSTVMLSGHKKKGGNDFVGREGGNKPLDSFVFTADVFFPDTGEEAWVLDELFQELIIQEHHVGYNIPFSPSISININKGRLFLHTIWNEEIAKGTSVNENDLHYRGAYVGRINTDEEELYLLKKGFDNLSYLPYLKKGEWHNITLYVKLGYNENQQPRTVLYLDNTLVADWFTPNAYNCQEFGEYMEFGIYKWSWDTQERRVQTPIKQRVIYFDNIHYYI